MSSFDVVNFLCPKCHALIAVSAMHGQGTPAKHSAFSVPIEVAGPLVGDKVMCEECFESFIVQPDEIKYVVLRLIPVE